MIYRIRGYQASYLVQVLVGSSVLQSFVTGINSGLSALYRKGIGVHDVESLSLDFSSKVAHHLDDSAFGAMVQHLYQR